MVASLALLSVLAPPAPFVCVNNQVIATVQKQKWSVAPISVGKGVGKIELIGVGLGKLGQKSSAKGIDAVPEIEGAFLRDPSSDADVLVYGLKPSFPRPVEIVATKPCRQWVAGWLKLQKIKPKTFVVFKAYTADLDGDGSKETIVEAASRKGLGKPDSTENPKDFSAVLLRTGKKTLALQSAKGGFNVCELKAIADFDGDGKMEIVSTSAYYEGFTATIHRFEGGKAKKLAESGSGA